MKTDDLIALLATGVTPVDPTLPEKRFRTALAAGLLGSVLWVLGVHGLRPDLAQVSHNPMLWVKFAFPASVGITALLISLRLSRPGMPVGPLRWALWIPAAGMGLLSALALIPATPDERVALVLGQTWRVCAESIAVAALPAFAASLWAFKGLAPTRPALAGASAGLLAGAVGALAYALHCPELAAPFLAVWNTLGMLIPAAIGAWLGPRVLKW